MAALARAWRWIRSRAALRLPEQPRKRRLAIFALGFAALLAIEQIPPLVFTFLLGYPWEQHGLSVQWRIFSWAVNVGVLIALLATELRALRSWLPRVYVAMAGLLFFCLWSSLYLTFVDRGSPLGFQLALWHMLAGRLATPLLIIYLFQHVHAWRATATPRERRAGRWLTIYTGVTLGVGIVFTTLGGPSELKFLPIHAWGSLALPLLILWHVRAERRWRARARGAETENLAARVPTFGRRGTAVSLAISVGLMLPPVALVRGWIRPPGGSPVRFVEAAGADRYHTEPPPAGYAETPGESPFAPARIQTESGQLVPARFLEQANGCSYEGCHTDIGKHWATSGHRHSRNVFVEKTMALLAEERGLTATRYCAACHDPVNVLAGQIDAAGQPVTGVDNEGVSCLVCHAASRIDEHPSNGSLVMGETPLFFQRALKLSSYLMVVLYLDDHRKELSRRPVLEDVRLCEACHRHEVPAELNPHRPVITDRVQEWRDGPFSKRDSQSYRACTDCHMPSTMESYQTETVRGHRFRSSNTGLAAYYASQGGWDGYAERYFLGQQQAAFTHAEDLDFTRGHLQSGIVRLALAPSDSEPAPGSVSFTATVRNMAVGHGWPAGIADLVDVWLELGVGTADGTVLWTSGVPDASGRIPDDAYRFGEQWYDDAGRPLRRHETWRLASVRNARRIPSGGTHVATFTVPLDPVPAGQSIHVHARLRHRRFRQDFIEWALGPGATLPISDVAEADLELLAPARRGTE